jgi:hypothetical protein
MHAKLQQEIILSHEELCNNRLYMLVTVKLEQSSTDDFSQSTVLSILFAS